jgi:hypothetical protein
LFGPCQITSTSRRFYIKIQTPGFTSKIERLKNLEPTFSSGQCWR